MPLEWGAPILCDFGSAMPGDVHWSSCNCGVISMKYVNPFLVSHFSFFFFFKKKRLPVIIIAVRWCRSTYLGKYFSFVYRNSIPCRSGKDYRKQSAIWLANSVWRGKVVSSTISTQSHTAIRALDGLGRSWHPGVSNPGTSRRVLIGY